MDKYCRVCARSDEFKIFPLETVSQTSDVRIDDMLIYCTQLEVTVADNLPQQICAECLTILNSAFNFRKMCFHSDNSFRNMLVDVLSEQEPTVSLREEQNALMEMTTNSFSDICIKQEHLAPEEFFDSIVAGAELEHLPTPYQMLNEQVELAQSSTRRTRKFRVSVCETCNYMTGNRFNFKRHQKTMNHSGSKEMSLSKPIQSVRRKRKMKIGRIVQYEKKILDKKFTCDDCGYQNDNQFNYKRHLTSGKHLKNSFLRLNPGTVKIYFQCDFCLKNCLKRHSVCKRLGYFEEGVPPDCFGFVPKRVIQDTLEIAKLTQEDGMPIFSTGNTNYQSNGGGSRPPLKLIESVIDYVHCYAISVQGFRCCKCSVFFVTLAALKKHRNSKHPIRRISGDSVNQCGRCFQPFLNEDSFRYHKYLEQSKWLIFCIACQVMIVGNTAWNAHSYFHHGKKTFFGSFEMIVVGEKFRCCSCDFILDSQEALETHQTEVHFPDWQNSLDSLELHECEKCFKQFATVKQLASHVELRMARRFFRCLTRNCRMEFKNKQEAVLHANGCFKTEPTVSTTEEEQPVIRCCFTDCLENFASKTELKTHIESIHNQNVDQKASIVENHVCDQCDMTEGKDQPKEEYVITEVQSNTQESIETECIIPSEPSIQDEQNRNDAEIEDADKQEHLEEQIRVEQEHSQVREHKCAHCDKSYFSGSALQMHVLKVHTKFKFICTVCGKRYKDKSTLIKHKATHKGFRRFQCPHCALRTGSQRFLRVHLLKVHSKTCKNERIAEST